MAEEQTAVEKKILEDSGIEKEKKPPKVNSYQMIGDLKIPVSSKRGPMWKSRIGKGKKAIEDLKDAWQEAIDYFHSDQMITRSGSRVKPSALRKDEPSEIENVVFSNVTAITPRIFSRNPRIEFTANFDDDFAKDFATVGERLINTILSSTSAPGVNLKAKARRAIIRCQLTNIVWAEVDYVTKDMTNEQTYQDVQRISKALQEAKTEGEIEALEAELEAIDEKYDLLSESGPVLNILNENEVIADPSCQGDFGNAQWMAKCAVFRTKFLEKKYMRKDKSGKKTLTFKPDYVVKPKKGREDGQTADNFSLFNKDEASAYGYDSQADYDSAKMSKVWFVWDKVTRRVELYLDHDFTWPLWVLEDPLKLPRFFPFFPLCLVTPIDGAYSKGEVSYYLDQQDAINDINEHARLARRWARFNIFYNTELISNQDMARVLEGGKTNGAHGLKLPAGAKITDAIFSIPPPGTNFMQLFDKTAQYQAVDRIVPINEAGRGGQFRTNTTNGAIQQYAESRAVRIGDKTDLVEDWISEIALALFQLCLMNFTAQEVAKLIGPINGEIWAKVAPVQPEKLSSIISSFTVASGSTQKPNSDEKQQQAINVVQVLGQFAKATPVALLVSLKVLQDAFDSVVVKEEDWELIRRSIEAQIGMSTDQAPGIDQGAEGQGQAQQAQQGQPGAGQSPIDQFLASIPPELQQQVVALIQSGTDPVAAIQQVTGQQVPVQ